MRSSLDESARELLAEEGYDPTFGARPLKRAIQTMIQNPLAMKLLSGEILDGQTVKVSAEGDRDEIYARNGKGFGVNKNYKRLIVSW